MSSNEENGKIVPYGDLKPGDLFRFYMFEQHRVWEVTDNRNEFNERFCRFLHGPTSFLNSPISGGSEYFSPPKQVKVVKLAPQRKCSISSLEQGARFRFTSADSLFVGALAVKTDGNNGDSAGLTAGVVLLEGKYNGLISYQYLSTSVIPEPGYQPKVDPWEEAEVMYGDLEPGDLFRRNRYDGKSLVHSVVNKRDESGDLMFISKNGNLGCSFDDDLVFMNSILEEYET